VFPNCEVRADDPNEEVIVEAEGGEKVDDELVPRASRSGNGWQVGQDEEDREDKSRKEDEEKANKPEADAPAKPDFDEMQTLISEGETLPIDYKTNLQTFRSMQAKVKIWQTSAMAKLKSITNKCVGSGSKNISVFEEITAKTDIQGELNEVIESAEGLHVQTQEER
jgi:hypothetical protein